MNSILILMLLIIGNLSLYWIFFGKKRFEEKLKEGTDDRETPGR